PDVEHHLEGDGPIGSGGVGGEALGCDRHRENLPVRTSRSHDAAVAPRWTAGEASWSPPAPTVAAVARRPLPPRLLAVPIAAALLVAACSSEGRAEPATTTERVDPDGTTTTTAATAGS